MFFGTDEAFSELTDGLEGATLGDLAAPQGMSGANMSQHVLDSATEDMAEKQMRSDAMSAALSFIEGRDFTQDALTALVSGLADVDKDGKISEEEREAYEELMHMTAEALVSLGAAEGAVREFLEAETPDEADESGQKLGSQLQEKLDATEADDDQLITEYALRQTAVMDATKRVVKDGKVVLKRVPTRKRRLSAAQRAALKKAQQKSHGAAARRARAKAMKIRKSRGM